MNLDSDELARLMDRAAERGARRVLAELGLDNGNKATRDIRDLRDLLHAWRVAKRTMLQTTVRIFTTLVLLALLAGAAVKLKVFGGGQ